jgi:hypothetical protein
LPASNKFISYLLLFSKEIPKYLLIDVEMVVKKVAANNNSENASPPKNERIDNA